MAESSRLKSRRRSSRSYSLLPSQDDLLKDVPTDIPGEERLRIFLRLCFKRALSVVRDEVDVPEELYRKLLLRGLSAFDEHEGHDALTMLLKVTAGSTPVDNELPAEVAAGYHTKLKDLLTECKRWNELLETDLDPVPPVQLATEGGNTDELPIARRRHYSYLARNAERARRAAAAFAYIEHRIEESGRTEGADTGDSLFDV